jgi:hypothetical protein
LRSSIDGIPMNPRHMANVLNTKPAAAWIPRHFATFCDAMDDGRRGRDRAVEMPVA